MNAEEHAAYRKRIEDALRQSGYPVDQWKADVERDLALNPKPKPASRTIEGYSKGRKMLRPGYQEYRPHGRHAGVMVPRCLAKAHHGNQCGSIAMNEAYHCARHGGRRPGQHRRGEDHHWHEGRGESRDQRRHRARMASQNRELQRMAVKYGLAPAAERRGPA